MQVIFTHAANLYVKNLMLIGNYLESGIFYNISTTTSITLLTPAALLQLMYMFLPFTNIRPIASIPARTAGSTATSAFVSFRVTILLYFGFP